MVRYSEGALIYSMGLPMFQRLAKEAGAIYRIEGAPPLVKCNIFEKYLKKFRDA
jgi:hypothetical protein